MRVRINPGFSHWSDAVDWYTAYGRLLEGSPRFRSGHSELRQSGLDPLESSSLLKMKNAFILQKKEEGGNEKNEKYLVSVVFLGSISAPQKKKKKTP